MLVVIISPEHPLTKIGAISNIVTSHLLKAFGLSTDLAVT